ETESFLVLQQTESLRFVFSRNWSTPVIRVVLFEIGAFLQKATDPVAIRRAPRVAGFDVVVLENLAGCGVERDDLAGAESAFFNRFGAFHFYGSNFATHDEQAIVGNLVARRTQAVTV